jgi:hypothetical protein
MSKKTLHNESYSKLDTNPSAGEGAIAIMNVF